MCSEWFSYQSCEYTFVVVSLGILLYKPFTQGTFYKLHLQVNKHYMLFIDMINYFKFIVTIFKYTQLFFIYYFYKFLDISITNIYIYKFNVDNILYRQYEKILNHPIVLQIEEINKYCLTLLNKKNNLFIWLSSCLLFISSNVSDIIEFINLFFFVSDAIDNINNLGYFLFLAYSYIKKFILSILYLKTTNLFFIIFNCKSMEEIYNKIFINFIKNHYKSIISVYIVWISIIYNFDFFLLVPLTYIILCLTIIYFILMLNIYISFINKNIKNKYFNLYIIILVISVLIIISSIFIILYNINIINMFFILKVNNINPGPHYGPPGNQGPSGPPGNQGPSGPPSNQGVYWSSDGQDRSNNRRSNVNQVPYSSQGPCFPSSNQGPSYPSSNQGPSYPSSNQGPSYPNSNQGPSYPITNNNDINTGNSNSIPTSTNNNGTEKKFDIIVELLSRINSSTNPHRYVMTKNKVELATHGEIVQELKDELNKKT